jgi:hypothetical protein
VPLDYRLAGAGGGPDVRGGALGVSTRPGPRTCPVKQSHLAASHSEATAAAIRTIFSTTTSRRSAALITRCAGEGRESRASGGDSPWQAGGYHPPGRVCPAGYAGGIAYPPGRQGRLAATSRGDEVPPTPGPFAAQRASLLACLDARRGVALSYATRFRKCAPPTSGAEWSERAATPGVLEREPVFQAVSDRAIARADFALTPGALTGLFAHTYETLAGRAAPVNPWTPQPSGSASARPAHRRGRSCPPTHLHVRAGA